MSQRLVIFAFLLLLTGSILRAQTVYDNGVFEDEFHTVQLHPVNQPFGSPLLQLRTPERLVLSFDEMGDNVSDLRYAVIQCDYDWKPTGNSTFDYIDGFSDGYVTDYDYSFNTLTSYVHYKLEIPNEDFNLLQSGNYVVVVFREDIDKPVLVRRFRVVDPRVAINGGVAYTRNPSMRDRYQEVVFSVFHKGFEITNPYQEIKVVVTQNDRWDNAITDLRPLFIGEDELSYNYNARIIFPTGREYREMDIRTLRYRTEGVRAIDVRDTVNIVYLMPDGMRRNQDYRAEGDLNGKYIIDRQEGRIGDLEADYAQVHFQLPFDTRLSNGSFYVVGGFNDYQLSDKNRMEYNALSASYEASLWLKQGFYNYIYVFVEDGSDLKDHSFTEGNYYDTENDYAVYVYFRPFGEWYDQLIGVSFFNSKLTRY